VVGVKVLVYTHALEIGGTQVNAIDLAAAIRERHGHDVVVFATPGPMAPLVNERGLRFIPAPVPRLYPSPARMRALRTVVRMERPALLHVWDWWQCLEAYYAVHLPLRLPMVVTDMMMSLTRILPRHVPTTFGTPQLADAARAAGRTPVEALLPPVDVHANASEAVDAEPFRRAWDIDDNAVTLVIVSRLAEWMKSEGLFRSIAAVATLARELPLRLMIVGDGAVRPDLEREAAAVNTSLGRNVVTLTGALLDPRPAYAAADIVLGMGGSALRAMAFAKPVIILGEDAFAVPLTPSTAPSFLYDGIYGRGHRERDKHALAMAVRRLAERPDEREALGRFSRRFVVDNFSLESVAARLARFYDRAVQAMPARRVRFADSVRTAAIYVRERRFLSA
jgi:glycosyltransferase involved in cell wall biosynthesis